MSKIGNEDRPPSWAKRNEGTPLKLCQLKKQDTYGGKSLYRVEGATLLPGGLVDVGRGYLIPVDAFKFLIRADVVADLPPTSAT